MKKPLIVCASTLLVLSLSACGGVDNTGKENKADNSAKESKQEKKKKEDTTITSLNKFGTIKDEDGKAKYQISINSVKDVTKKNSVPEFDGENGEESNLEHYTNNLGTQAVQITATMKNNSGEELSAPYLENATVLDEKDTNFVGGWKLIGSSSVEFGYSNGTDPIVKDESSGVAASVVGLQNKSKEITIIFNSEKFRDNVKFKLPVNE